MVTGPEIRDARRRAGWSQKDLADRVGVVARTIGGWERGENTPGMNEPKLMAVLRDYLVNVEPEPLRAVSDVELLAEVARRLARSERRERGDGDDGRDAASIAAVTDLADRRPAAEVDEQAARDVGREGTLTRRRREQDEAGQQHSDDPDDMEPR